MLSHRYNMLVENKLHLDELDEEHTGAEQQIRMFVQLDKKRPRVLTFGPDLEQMYKEYYDEFNLGELDKNNIHTFITEMRNRCVWNEQNGINFITHFIILHLIHVISGSLTHSGLHIKLFLEVNYNAMKQTF